MAFQHEVIARDREGRELGRKVVDAPVSLAEAKQLGYVGSEAELIHEWFAARVVKIQQGLRAAATTKSERRDGGKSSLARKYYNALHGQD